MYVVTESNPGKNKISSEPIKYFSQKNKTAVCYIGLADLNGSKPTSLFILDRNSARILSFIQAGWLWIPITLHNDSFWVLAVTAHKSSAHFQYLFPFCIVLFSRYLYPSIKGMFVFLSETSQIIVVKTKFVKFFLFYFYLILNSR